MSENKVEVIGNNGILGNPSIGISALTVTYSTLPLSQNINQENKDGKRNSGNEVPEIDVTEDFDRLIRGAIQSGTFTNLLNESPSCCNCMLPLDNHHYSHGILGFCDRSCYRSYAIRIFVEIISDSNNLNKTVEEKVKELEPFILVGYHTIVNEISSI